MKQKTILRTLLLVMAMLIVGSGQLWADVYTISFNGSDAVSSDGFFTTAGKHNFSNKFNDVTYAGINFSNGLKMEGSTQIKFSTVASSTVTIVQSTWSDATIKLDEAELAVADAEAGTGCRIYTVSNVAAGDHTISRGSGESGLFYIKVEINDNRTATSLSFATTSGSQDINDGTSFTLPTLTKNPSTLTGVKFSSTNPAVATVDENTGAVTLLKLGKTTIKATFDGDNTYRPSSTEFALKVEDRTKFNLANLYVAHSYDFEFMNGVTPSIASTKAGSIYNAGNKKNNDVFRCTNAGLEFLAIQAAFSSKKGYKIEKGVNKGLLEGSGAGRCAAICDVKAGQYIEFYHTSENFYTKSDGSDNGARKTEIIAELGHHVYLVEEDGMVGFELDPGKYVNQVIIYTENSADAQMSNTVNHLMRAGVSYKSGTSFNYPAITMTYGETGGADFNAAAAYTDLAGYAAYTTGNETNSNQEKGSFYTFAPQYPGTINVGVLLNNGKDFYISEDGTTMAGYPIQKAEKYYGTFDFDVLPGKTYKVYASNTKLGFFGFKFNVQKAENISAFKQLAEGKAAEVTLTNAKVTAVVSGVIYLEDDGAGIAIKSDANLSVGETLNGTICLQRTAEGATAVGDHDFVTSAGTAVPATTEAAEAVSAAKDGKYVKLENVTVTKKELGGKKYLFTNNKGWEKVYAYAWILDGGFSEPFGSWPGTELTNPLLNGMMEPQFSVNVPDGIAGLIFNAGNGQPQTVDITGDLLNNGGFYLMNTNGSGNYEVGTWGDPVDAASYYVNKDGQKIEVTEAIYRAHADLDGKKKLTSIAGIAQGNSIAPTKEEDIVASADQSLNEVSIADFKTLAQDEEAKIQESAVWATFIDGDNVYIQNANEQAIIVKRGSGLNTVDAGQMLNSAKIEAALVKEGADAPAADNTPNRQVSFTEGDDVFASPRFDDISLLKTDDLVHAMVRMGRSSYGNGKLMMVGNENSYIKVVDKFNLNIDIPEDLSYIVGIIGKEGADFVFYPVHEDSLRQYTNVISGYNVGDVQDKDENSEVADFIGVDEQRKVTGVILTATEEYTIVADAVTVGEGDKQKDFTHKAQGSEYMFDASRDGILVLYTEKQAQQPITVTEDGKVMNGFNAISQSKDSIQVPVVAGKVYVVSTTKPTLNLRGFTFRSADPEAVDVARNIAAFKSINDGVTIENRLMLNDAIVTYVKGDDVFVEDATGAILFQKTLIQFYPGQRLNGYIVGKNKVVKNMPTLSRSSKTDYKTFKAKRDSAEATVMTIADMQQKKNIARYIQLENVLVQREKYGFPILVDTLTGERIRIEDHFNTHYNLVANDTVKSILGIVGVDADGRQYLWPTSRDSINVVKYVAPAPEEEVEPEPQPGDGSVTATLTLNGSEVSDPEGFFTHDASGKFNFNNKFKDASYDGTNFENGLKMEGSTKITFTAPDVATVTIVQSTWSDKTLKFDGTELAVADAAEGTGCRVYTIENVAAGDHDITRGSGESGLFMVKVTYSPVPTRNPENWDFQELCMKLGKGGPWAVNDGEDAGFTVNGATMHFLGDYAEQGFEWNNHIAYEYVADRGKFTMRNKNNKKDKNCGMFSWDYTHYVSLPELRNGDKVTITIPTGEVTFVSDNVEGVAAGDKVESGKVYTITTTDATTRLDIQMDKASLIGQITIEPAGAEVIPTITINKATLALIPAASTKLTASSTPSSAVKHWKSSNESVATVAEDGTVTAVSAGTANIICFWKSDTSDKTSEAVCAVTVADVDLSQYGVVKSYDFTQMGDVTLVEGDEAGAIYNAANKVNNKVYFCSNEGLEQIAIQAALSGGKGWSIVDGKGLELASGAGRCAAVTGLRAGQIVEILYTGDNFYTSSTDDSAAKTALNEGAGRAIYKADADGMIGFELDKGNDVQKIIIYDDPNAIRTLSAERYVDGAVYNLKGQKVADSTKGLKSGIYIVNGKKVAVQ